jgi:hypothetical protein
MATDKNAKAMCDECGFVYPLRVMRLSKYGTLRCPQCFDGRYDLKNHPQNRVPDTRDDPTIQNARPDDGGRNLEWQLADITWNDIPEPDDRKWGTV